MTADQTGLFHRSPEEDAVWKLEHSCWEFVKARDLSSYSELWHDDFVAWPHINSRPVRKNQVTEWISANSAQGIRLESYSLKHADSQATENLVVVHYWLTSTWTSKDKNVPTTPLTLRIMHTWIKSGKGWRIITGMSTPEAETQV
jgi:ketosteroid isomerase-like protein